MHSQPHAIQLLFARLKRSELPVSYPVLQNHVVAKSDGTEQRRAEEHENSRDG